MTITKEAKKYFIKVLDEIEKMESILKVKSPAHYEEYSKSLRDLYMDAFILTSGEQIIKWGQQVEELFNEIKEDITGNGLDERRTEKNDRDFLPF